MSDWPATKEAQLRELWALGMTGAAIARRLDVTPNAVVGKAHRLKLEARPSPIPRPGYVPPRVANAKRPNRDRVVAAPPPPVVMPVVGSVGRTKTCQWIEGSRRQWLTCDAASAPGMSWCPAHKDIVFTKVAQP